MVRLNEFKVGARVQLHPATDRWMRGDRFGEVIQTSMRMPRKRADGTRPDDRHTYRYKVLLDKSGDSIWFKEEDLRPAE